MWLVVVRTGEEKSWQPCAVTDYPEFALAIVKVLREQFPKWEFEACKSLTELPE